MSDAPGATSILDDPAAMARADTQGMLGFVARFADQVGEGWRISRGLTLPWGSPHSVALLGMGGSAIGGDLVKGIYGDRITVPFEIVRGYELPAWVGPDTLVIASSKSGDTEETLSALQSALERRCPVVAVSTGGAIATVARAAGLPFAAFPVTGFAPCDPGLLAGHRRRHPPASRGAGPRRGRGRARHRRLSHHRGTLCAGRAHRRTTRPSSWRGRWSTDWR